MCGAGWYGVWMAQLQEYTVHKQQADERAAADQRQMASLSATVGALRLEVEQAKLSQPDEATAAQVHPSPSHPIRQPCSTECSLRSCAERSWRERRATGDATCKMDVPILSWLVSP